MCFPFQSDVLLVLILFANISIIIIIVIIIIIGRNTAIMSHV